MRGFGDGGYVGVAFEEFADGAAEDAGAVAVDDADAGEAGEESAVPQAETKDCLSYGICASASGKAKLQIRPSGRCAFRPILPTGVNG